MRNTYGVISHYDKTKGMTVSINGANIELSVADVCYLLLKVDGVGTASADTPPGHIPFMLRGKVYTLSNEEWMDFHDQVASVAGMGGWDHTVCK